MNSRFSSGFLAAVTLSVSLTPQFAKADFHEDASDLTGVWTFHVSQTVPKSVDFVALNNFSKDGIYMSSTQSDYFCCPAGGTAYGVWTKTGSNQFAVTFNALIGNADQTLFGTFTVNFALPWIRNQAICQGNSTARSRIRRGMSSRMSLGHSQGREFASSDPRRSAGQMWDQFGYSRLRKTSERSAV